MLVPDFIIESNAQNKVNNLANFFKKPEKILDVGCGDLSLAKKILSYNSHLKITGIDVVDFKKKVSGINFVVYDGKHLPFKNASFDTVILYHVLHHCPDPLMVLKECLRVSNKRVIMIEPVYRNRVEIPFMWFMDWIFNVWKSQSISLPYGFRTKKEWHSIFRNLGTVLTEEKDIDKFPDWIPIGRGYLFSLKIH